MIRWFKSGIIMEFRYSIEFEPNSHRSNTMAMVETSSLLYLLVALVISTVIIYFVTKFMGEKEGLGTALVAAIIGTVVYILAYFLFGNGLLAAVVAGIVWLLALKGLYKIGWVKALIIAVLIWVFATIIGYFLPTLSGPF
jgi:uncharacterized membrane-anchored protein